jgi:hypothetical protein
MMDFSAALHESGYGTKLTSSHLTLMSACGDKPENICFL